MYMYVCIATIRWYMYVCMYNQSGTCMYVGTLRWYMYMYVHVHRYIQMVHVHVHTYTNLYMYVPKCIVPTRSYIIYYM